MKLRWKIVSGVLALASVSGLILLSAGNDARRDLEETRRQLRSQGCKTDLKDFDFPLSPELRSRAAILGTTTRAAITNRDRSGPTFQRAVLELPEFLTPVGSNAALVAWNRDQWVGLAHDDLWPQWRKLLVADHETLDAARRVAVSGPIRFEPIGAPGPNALLPYLADLKQLETTFTMQAVLALHDGQKDAAWTNLFAASCLAAAYIPESREISHRVRFACATIAYAAAWDLLQSHDWTEAQLASLQQCWESADFFQNLAETAAFDGAEGAAECQLERRQKLHLPPLTGLIRHPADAWQELNQYWGFLRYRHTGSYEDEKVILLHYRDRELEIRRAVQCPTWSEMRAIPGITNVVPFTPKHPSRIQVLLNMKRSGTPFSVRSRGFVGLAAEAEARRRLLITALALERYRGRNGSYPGTLAALVPTCVPSVPLDFMDGKPLRYYPTPDGHFVLYSLGLDCVDNGGDQRPEAGAGLETSSSGNLPNRWRRRGGFRGLGNLHNVEGSDLVWPRPASTAETLAWQQEEARQAELERAAQEESLASARKEVERERQVVVANLLAAAQTRRAATALSFHGQPLVKLLRNENTTGTNLLTLDELLTCRFIGNGADSGRANFELPVNYNILTNLGRLHLLLDGELDAASLGEAGERQTCERATNGNCLLTWQSSYDPPGLHAIQAEFVGCREDEPNENALKVTGPVLAFASTNLCQFDSAYDRFDSYSATLYARLPESNGVYAIEITTPSGEHLKTFAGTTTNGVIKVHWDLVDDHGQRFTNSSFDSVFHVTLPDSGRSQTLKGP